MMNPYQNNMYPQFFNPYMVQQSQPIQQSRGLNGMVVQSADRITADCVPMDGSAAFFPKQDMSEIYVKNWCADGTIRTLIYKPVQPDAPKDVQADANKIASGVSQSVAETFERHFAELSEKLDRLEQSVTKPMTKSRSSMTKKEDAE